MSVSICLLAHDAGGRLEPGELHAALGEFEELGEALAFREFDGGDSAYHYALFPRTVSLREPQLIRIHSICRTLDAGDEEAQEHSLYDYYENMARYEVLREVPEDELFAAI